MGCALTATADRTSSPYGSLSLWHETADDDWTLRAPLPGSTEVDVAIVGAGFTGLWTAYHLAQTDPALRIAVLEREVAGFGASGRNGGWCSALFPASAERLAQPAGRDAAIRQLRALQDSVQTVGEVVAAEGIDAHYHRGGMVELARTGVQLRRLRGDVAESRRWGQTSDDLVLLDAVEARERCAATHVLGAAFTPHCAAVHPARLVRGLARAVERRGVRIHEQTAVDEISPGRVRTAAGVVRADMVVRATEGYTRSLAGERLRIAPVYSLMVATEPLPDEVWTKIGLFDREALSDGRYLIIYAQRTADGRLAFGGRGAPYHFGSRVRPAYDREPRVFRQLEAIVRSMFPILRDAAFTHRWGGPLGVPRDWHASVGLDRATGLAWGGGYVGDGVGASQLAGRTLADLITGQDSDLVRLPWVGHQSPRWEPEPLRWLEVNAGLRVMKLADAEERITRRSSVLARAMSRFLGGH
ncbi:MAG: FAD-binding oxidoreductase [Actinomycetota bacterium]|nr:FAD-binding oxidoreductase [Actinomycetota bacterium]